MKSGFRDGLRVFFVESVNRQGTRFRGSVRAASAVEAAEAYYRDWGRTRGRVTVVQEVD